MTATAALAEMAATSWLTVAQVAEMVGKKPRTVRRWCRIGFLSGARQIGRGWQIPESAVDALLNPEPVAA